MRIRGRRRGVMLILFALLCGGCQSDPVLITEEDNDIPVDTPAARHAIRLTLTSGRALNVYHHMSNSCAVLVLQTRDNQLQQKILDEPQILRTLFRDDSGGNEKGILKKDLFMMMPSRKRTLQLDRVKDARYLLIVAGYYPAPALKDSIRMAIPVVRKKNGWWWAPDYRGELQPLSLDIRLGARGMTAFPPEIQTPQ